MRLFGATVLLGLVLAGCTDRWASADRGGVVEVDTIGGIVHVRNSGHPLAWKAEPLLRLGTVQGGPAEFGRVRSLLADASGHIYVADNQTHEIRVFTGSGAHVRTIGRRGGGPGEFTSLYSLAWLGGRLVAMDPGNARIAVLTPEGEWLDGIRYYPITGPATLIRLHPVGDDAFYAPVIDPERRGGIPLVRFTSAGAADTVMSPRPAEGVRRGGVLCRRADGGITSIGVPEAPGMVYAFPPPGGLVALSWTETYRIAFVDAAGDTLRVVTRERPPLAYDDPLWDQAQEPHRALLRDFPGSQCEPSSLERPAARAALRHIFFDEAGRMWVEAATADGFAWDVFDAVGRLLGTAPAPARVAGIPPYARHGLLYQVETDAMDVQYVAVYRIIPDA